VLKEKLWAEVGMGGPIVLGREAPGLRGNKIWWNSFTSLRKYTRLIGHGLERGFACPFLELCCLILVLLFS